MEPELRRYSGGFEQGSPHTLFPSIAVLKLSKLYHPVRRVDTPNCISDLHVLAYRLQRRRMSEPGSELTQGEPIEVWATSPDFPHKREISTGDNRGNPFKMRHDMNLEAVADQSDDSEESTAASCTTPFVTWFSSRRVGLCRTFHVGP
ncbi:uncharacterized protein PHACADRAFT_246183 [Phanerochaete carnosa HHB-10118-sp]|uniref:Uncharacterized protein n=1 Tax=Phanerochaete carnosa (strain HHB-10118-sp) TaxID=650164 RepID=K5VBP6_PHACS|nr:uncharacterized protein PHACADRAFT_246183 [Phanerochaete carnosa HHB-10118-sp]EKM60321.1 hypothetical protein PHACADRAFT_246183 [Phanerochaete carnosa HHB-10118-sp]